MLEQILILQNESFQHYLINFKRKKNRLNLRQQLKSIEDLLIAFVGAKVVTMFTFCTNSRFTNEFSLRNPSVG